MSKESAAISVSIIESSSNPSAELDMALSVFGELSISSPCSKETKLEKKPSEMNRKGRQLEALSSLINICKRSHSRHSDVVSQRFLPYNVAMVIRRTKSAQSAKRSRLGQEESHLANLNAIRLEGCAFQGSLPPVSCHGKKSTSGDGKPCWLQYRDEQQNQSETSPALQSESDFEVDELSEYFDAFVTVKMKMSSQAESMYA
uniref:Oxidative stress-responsive protein 1 n=1 Tax=Ditylenchus dipsaci TaxID=166011 RepID=A0A915EIS8_9BILA